MNKKKNGKLSSDELKLLCTIVRDCTTQTGRAGNGDFTLEGKAERAMAKRLRSLGLVRCGEHFARPTDRGFDYVWNHAAAELLPAGWYDGEQKGEKSPRSSDDELREWARNLGTPGGMMAATRPPSSDKTCAMHPNDEEKGKKQP